MLDKGGYIYIMFVDLSKAFDTMQHNLTIAKLETYGFEKYLTNKHKSVPVNSNFSTSENIIAGVSQSSILRPLLFSIFINDPFLFVSSLHLNNYADGNTLLAFSYKLKEISNTVYYILILN